MFRTASVGTALFTLGLASCAAPSPLIRPAADDEKLGATKTYTDCLLRGAKNLDDGVSDPLSVGSVAAGGCEAERQHVADTFTRGQTARAAAMFAGLLRARAASDGAAAVLLVRRDRTNPPKP